MINLVLFNDEARNAHQDFGSVFMDGLTFELLETPRMVFQYGYTDNQVIKVEYMHTRIVRMQ